MPVGSERGVWRETVGEGRTMGEDGLIAFLSGWRELTFVGLAGREGARLYAIRLWSTGTHAPSTVREKSEVLF